jgi:hypothetical protein
MAVKRSPTNRLASSRCRASDRWAHDPLADEGLVAWMKAALTSHGAADGH